MRNLGLLLLRDRSFQVVSAELRYTNGSWLIEIETERQEFDGEVWSPYLYHQGLSLPAASVESLIGVRTAWHLPFEGEPSHPEAGTMYVFGHHFVRDCVVEFGKIEDGRIQLSWIGTCDVHWEGEFNTDVPFNCSCAAAFT